MDWYHDSAGLQADGRLVERLKITSLTHLNPSIATRHINDAITGISHLTFWGSFLETLFIFGLKATLGDAGRLLREILESRGIMWCWGYDQG